MILRDSISHLPKYGFFNLTYSHSCDTKNVTYFLKCSHLIVTDGYDSAI